ncbi:MAG: ADP-glyceromanno-heptose 6-epimerase [Candidatus Micrarchaeota archaeon]|nr:ADP-glyceromanno-heptose 6-epimerase [Candidatus Micrarchaeota archaeon]
MIVVTGGAGFIGSALIWKLNENNINEIIIVDNFKQNNKKWRNLLKRRFVDIVDRDLFFVWFEKYNKQIKVIFHLGACTNTMEENVDYILRTNYEYSKKIYELCCKYEIPLIYASSAATYGRGEKGYNDDEKIIPLLKPLNLYGWSKQLFDLWVLNQKDKPPQLVGLKFFNVYGPNEYHKGRMASVVFHAYNQIRERGRVNLFKSYKKEIPHGEQKRDFIYIKDVVECLFKIYLNKNINGIFNLGTGIASSFNELATFLFESLSMKKKITYIPMPVTLITQYQYYTNAQMTKFLSFFKDINFYTLKEGIFDYVKNYLTKDDPYL